MLKECLTITFRYHLGNDIHTLFVTSDFQFRFHEHDRYDAESLKMILDFASCCNAAIHEWPWRVPDRTAKLSHQAIENLMDIKKYSVVRVVIGRILTGARKRDPASSVVWFCRVPYWINKTSIHHNVSEKCSRNSGTAEIEQRSVAKFP